MIAYTRGNECYLLQGFSCISQEKNGLSGWLLSISKMVGSLVFYNNLNFQS